MVDYARTGSDGIYFKEGLTLRDAFAFLAGGRDQFMFQDYASSNQHEPAYSVAVEFREGAYAEIGEDCLGLSINRALGDAENRISAGRCTIVLHNDGKFSPANSSSMYYGYLAPNKRVRVKALYDGGTYQLFNGRTTTFRVQPQLGQRLAVIEAADVIEELQRQRIDTGLYPGYAVGSLFTEVFSLSGISSASAVDSQFYDTVPFFWANNKRPIEAVQQLVDVGYYAGLYVRGDGKLIARNRYAGSGATTQASYAQFYSYESELDVGRLYTSVRVEGQPKRQKTGVGTVGWLSDVVRVPARYYASFVIDFVDQDDPNTRTAANSVITPVASTDYYATTNPDGTGTIQTDNLSLSLTIRAQSVVCSLFNSSFIDASLQRFQFRGYSIQEQPAVSVRTEVASAIVAYGERELELASDLVADSNYARELSRWLVRRMHIPYEGAEIALKNVWPDCLQREVLDLIHVVESVSAVSSDMLVRELEHTISFDRGLEHTTRMSVRLFDVQPYLWLNQDPKGKLNQRRLAF